MGRPKTGSKYMEETCAYSIRVRKELLNKFMKTFEKKKKKLRLTENKSYYVNGLFSEWLEQYISANEESSDVK